MEATPSQTPAVVTLPSTVRSMGATLGAVLGLSAMGMLYVASAVPAVESVLHVQYLLGPDGIGSREGHALAWAIAPVAALIAGWISAPRALVGRRFAGVRMGFWTYAIAIVIAPLVVFGPSVISINVIDGEGRPPVEAILSFMVAVPVIAAIAGVVLAPLLVACAGAGVVWAAAVRWVTRGSGGPGPQADIPETDTRLLLVMAAILGLLWLLFAVATLGSSFLGGDLID